MLGRLVICQGTAGGRPAVSRPMYAVEIKRALAVGSLRGLGLALRAALARCYCCSIGLFWPPNNGLSFAPRRFRAPRFCPENRARRDRARSNENVRNNAVREIELKKSAVQGRYDGNPIGAPAEHNGQDGDERGLRKNPRRGSEPASLLLAPVVIKLISRPPLPGRRVLSTRARLNYQATSRALLCAEQFQPPPHQPLPIRFSSSLCSLFVLIFFSIASCFLLAPSSGYLLGFYLIPESVEQSALSPRDRMINSALEVPRCAGRRTKLWRSGRSDDSDIISFSFCSRRSRRPALFLPLRQPAPRKKPKHFG